MRTIAIDDPDVRHSVTRLRATSQCAADVAEQIEIVLCVDRLLGIHEPCIRQGS